MIITLFTIFTTFTREIERDGGGEGYSTMYWERREGGGGYIPMLWERNGERGGLHYKAERDWEGNTLQCREWGIHYNALRKERERERVHYKTFVSWYVYCFFHISNIIDKMIKHISIDYWQVLFSNILDFSIDKYSSGTWFTWD